MPEPRFKPCMQDQPMLLPPDIKRNWGFRRFLLRGLEKVDHEMRMVAMGHNIRKMAYALAV